MAINLEAPIPLGEGECYFDFWKQKKRHWNFQGQNKMIYKNLFVITSYWTDILGWGYKLLSDIFFPAPSSSSLSN